jgi:hypothetical protein
MLTLVSRRRLGILGFCAWLASAGACGPEVLPAFANPPPEPDAASDAQASLDDAGSDRLDASAR